jgi:hypothetical protein
MANPYLDYLAAQFPQLRQAVAQSRQADQLRAMMYAAQQARPQPAPTGQTYLPRNGEHRRYTAGNAPTGSVAAPAAPVRPPIPVQQTPPTLTPQQAAALVPYVGFNINEAPNTQQRPVAPLPPPPVQAPYPIPVATPQQAMGMAGLNDQPNPQQPSTGGWSNANVGLLGFDPQVEYQNLLANGVAPLTARQLVEDGIKEREMRYRQEQGIAMSTAKAAETPPGFDANRPVNAAGDAIGTAAEAVLPVVEPVLDYGQKQARIAQADLVVSSVKQGREAGMTDRQIINQIKGTVNPFMWSLPFGEFDSDAEITAFFDGLLKAYDEGFIAYGQDTIAPGQVGMGPTRPIVGQWGPGAEAAHEYMAGEENVLEKITEAVVLDPLNAVGALGAGGRAAMLRGAALAAKDGKAATVAGRALQGVGAGLRAPDAVLNVAPDLIVGKAIGGTLNMIGENVPGLNLIYDKLRRTPDNIATRAGGEDLVNALSQEDRVAQGNASAAVANAPQPTPGVTSANNQATVGGTIVQTGIVPANAQATVGGNAYGPNPNITQAHTQATVGGNATAAPNPNQITEADARNTVGGNAVTETVYDDNLLALPTNRTITTNEPSPPVESVTQPTVKETAVSGKPAVRVTSETGDYRVRTTKEGYLVEQKVGTKFVKVREPYLDKDEAVAEAVNLAGGTPTKAVPDAPDLRDTEQQTLPGVRDVRSQADIDRGITRYEVDTPNGTYRISGLDGAGRYPFKATRVDSRSGFPELEMPTLDGLLTSLGNRVGADIPGPPTAAIPETPVTVNGTKRTMESLTDEERLALIRDPNSPVTELTPRRGDGRFISKVQELGDKNPELWDEFVEKYKDPAQTHLEALAKNDAEIAYIKRSTMPGPDKLALSPADRKTMLDRRDELVKDSSMLRLEHVVNVEAPLTVNTFRQLPDMTPTAPRSPHSATNELLMQEYVFSKSDKTAADALRVMRGRTKLGGQPWWAGIEARLIAARNRMQQLYRDMQNVGFAAPGFRHFVGKAERLVDDADQLIGQGAVSDAPLLPPGQRVTNPDQQLAFADRQRIETRFTGATNPEYKGKTALQVRNEIREGLAAARARNAEIEAMLADPTTIPLPKTKAAQAKFDVKKAIKQLRSEQNRLAQPYSKYLDNPFTDDLNAASNELTGLAYELDVNPDVFKHHSLAVDLVDALIRRSQRHILTAEPITSTGYSMRNIIGNAQVGTIADPAFAEHLTEYVRQGLRETRDVLRPNAIEVPAENMSLGARTSGDLGRGVQPHRQYTKAAEWGTAQDVIGIGSHTPTRMLAERLHLGKIPKFFDSKRSFDAGWDRAGKLTFYGHTLRGTANEEIPDLVDLLAKLSVRRDLAVTRDEWTRLLTELRKPETGVFSPDDVYDAVFRLARDRGLDTTRARNMAKPAADLWTNLGKRAEDRAIELTNHAFPSQRRMTNADTYLSYVTLFHFWPSRTARLVLEEMIRHPQMYNWWQKSHDGLERMAEEGNYPDSVRMLMYIAESPFGFALYANPVSLYLVTALNPDTPDYPDAKGVTKLGSVLKDIRQQTGLGLAPFLDAALNIAGVYGDSFPPNPWPSRAAELAGASLDYALIRMGHSPGTPIYDNTMAKLRSWVSGSAIAPGTSNVPYRDQSTYTQDIVGSLVLDNNPKLAERILQTEMGADGRVHPTADATAARIEFAAIMENEDHPEYQQAELDAAAQKVTTLSVNAISPFSIKAKVSSREWAIQGAGDGWDALDAGNEPSPYQAGMMQTRDTVNSTPEDNILQAQENQFYALGSDRQNALSDGWTAIAYPDDTLMGGGLGITIGGTFISRDDLLALEQSDRSDIADAWVAEQGGTEELQAFRDEKAKYIAEHPEYADFDGYKDIAYDYEGGVRAFRLDRAEANPNFNRAMEAKRSDLKDDGMNAKLIENELDEWATSIAGYEAAQGITGGLYDPEPISTGDQATIDTISKMGGTGGFGGGVSGTGKPGKSTAAKLTADMAEYEHDLKIVEGVIRQNGIDIGPDGLSGVTGPYAVDSLNSMFGDLMPQKTKLQRDYEEWVMYQPRGADTSPAAFGAYLDKLAADESLDDLLAAAAD